MKKLFSVLIVFVLVFVIFGCEATRKEAIVYDGSVTLTVVTPSGILTREVGYFIADEKNLFDLLVETFTVEYQMFEFGPFITDIEDLHASYGSFISITHNGEPAMVGASDLEYVDGDTIVFELSWWDEDAQSIYVGIISFLDNYLERYTEEGINYYVLTGLKHLNRIDELSVDLSTLSEPETMFETIHHILIRKALDSNDETIPLLQESLYGMATIGWPYGTGLMMMALSGHDTLDLSTLTQGFIDDLNTRELATLDLDTLSMALLALEGLDHQDIPSLIDEILAAIETNLYTSSYGDNAASFAHVILALLAQGLDPRDEEYDYDTIRFFDYFMNHLNEDGSFNYTLDDGDADLLFATPQGFLALVMMHQALNSFPPIVHPFVN